jgi:hypothetical protein
MWAALAGCAGYEGDVRAIREALLAGDRARALTAANAALDVDEPAELPRNVGGDNALLVLERGMVKQGLGLWKPASRDFLVADRHLELLDLRNDAIGGIGKWLFSDSATVYKAPPHEKLLLSTLAMLNYLAAGDLEGARVEARRLQIMRAYLADAVSPEEARTNLGVYLAAFVWEMSGRHEQALRAYDELLATGSDHPSAAAPIRRLAACSEFRSERFAPLLGEPDPAAPPPGCDSPPGDRGTVLVVAQLGLAPYKVATRLPIGAALVIAGTVMYGPGLGASSDARARELAAKGLLKWVNFPRLERDRSRFQRVRVRVNERAAGTELGENVGELVTRSWDRLKGTVMVAAITRMITRAVAGEATQQAAKSGGAAGGLALLAGLAVEGALVAADTPDTRSWVTLPSHVVVSRSEVPPGRQQVVVDFEGHLGRERRVFDVDVAPGGFAVVVVAAMR